MSNERLVRALEAGLEQSPAAFVASGRTLTTSDLERIVESWRTASSGPQRATPSEQEIWPLISHHGFDGRKFFCGDAWRTMLPRVLSILLIHDGLVVADPLADVARLLAHGRNDEALVLATNVLQGVASCADLLDRGVMRFTSHRPALADTARKEALETFNVDPSMQVFTNFIEAAATVGAHPDSFEIEYRPQVIELYARLGLSAPLVDTLEHAVAAVRDLAAALIEVSWQMAICADDSGCDVSLVSSLELSVTALVLESATDPTLTRSGSGVGRTRHLARLNAGDVPNVDASMRSVGDALSIRESDAFSEFRQQSASRAANA